MRILSLINGKDKKSIRSRIILIFIIITVVMNLVFFFSITKRNRINTLYQQNVDINLKLNQLSLELNNNARFFDLYFQRRTEDYMENYLITRDNISRLMNELKTHIAKDDYSNIFYRNLTNMLNYHDELFEDIFATDFANPEIYTILTNIKTLYSYMNRHTQTMIHSYLGYSSNKYIGILKSYQDMEKNIYLVIILTSIMCFVFALALSNDILKTIDELSNVAHSLSNGHWEISDIKQNKYEELNILGQTFNLMKNNINKYIRELKEKSQLEIKLNKERMDNIEKDRLLRESQLLNLQMQMEPHFLFNTLNTVARIAMFEGAQKTLELIVAISKIMRYNLNNKGKMVELNKEIEVLEAYLIIQQVRFQEQMDFKINIEGDISGIRIPPMILQPVVENAIIHGLSDKLKDGKLDIRVVKKSKLLKIKISDNGKGIKKDKLSSIFQQKERKENASTTGLGLLNVKKRLEFYYGTDLINISSIYGQGTDVKIKIPFSRGDQSVKTNDCGG